MSSMTATKYDDQFNFAINSVIKAFHAKTEFQEKELSNLQKDLIDKDAEISLLEKQLNKANFDNDQIFKTNESLIIENKLMMEEIGNLKRILMKIDDWKLNFYDYVYKHDYLEKEILKCMLTDFPSYSELKENFEGLKNLNYRINYQSNNYPKEYLLSSFNSNSKSNEFNRNFISNAEKENLYSNDYHENIKIRNKNSIDSQDYLPSRKFDERQFNSEANSNSIKRPKELLNLDEGKRKYYDSENQKKFVEKNSKNEDPKIKEDPNTDNQKDKNAESRYQKDQLSKGKNLKNEINENQMLKNYNYSPKINSFSQSSHDFSPRSENNLNFNYKNTLEKQNKINTPQSNKKFETENNHKINHNRYHSRNFDSYKNANFEKAEKDGRDSERYPNSVGRTSQYLLSSKFFSECRSNIKKNEYDILIDTLKSFNKNEISKNEAFDRIGRVLEPYQKLYRDFRSIFLK